MTITFEAPRTFYVYVGGKGDDATHPWTYANGGWNGGGAEDVGDNEHSGGGGGASEVRAASCIAGGQRLAPPPSVRLLLKWAPQPAVFPTSPPYRGGMRRTSRPGRLLVDI
jgi:hypothetical protein